MRVPSDAVAEAGVVGSLVLSASHADYLAGTLPNSAPGNWPITGQWRGPIAVQYEGESAPATCDRPGACPTSTERTGRST